MMNHITNNPYPQPDQHQANYDHAWSDDAHPTADSVTVHATFHQLIGMPTPWKHWEDALHILLDNIPLQDLTGRRGLDFTVMDDFTVSNPGPEGEYEIVTATKFALHRQNPPNRTSPIKGQGKIFRTIVTNNGELRPDPTAMPIATVWVSISIQEQESVPQERNQTSTA